MVVDRTEPTGIDDLGKVVDNQIWLTLGYGTATVDGKKIKVCATVTGEPVLYCEEKTFHLPWEHIIWLARERGLLE